MTSPRSSTERVLRALVDICGPHFARPAGPRDTVAGRPARFVAAPATTGGVVDVLRLAAAGDLAVVTRGAGTKIDWGVPPAGVDLLLDTRRLAGLWDHRVDESTVEIGAGTPVRSVQAALALHGRRLALDPPSAGATVGGVLAVHECGPLRYRFGAPDEQVHRYAYVGADGTPGERPGGAAGTVGDHEASADRHAAGPDAAGDAAEDALAGGVLVSARLALQPLPAARRWVSQPVRTPLQVHNVVAGTLDADVSPGAIEADLPAPGAGGQRPGVVAVLLEGSAVDVRERAARLTAALGAEASTADTAPAWWGRYPFVRRDVALRLAVSSADLHAVVYALRDAAGGAVPVRGSVGMGTVHAVLSGQSDPRRVEEILDAVRAVLLGRGGRCVVVSAPPSMGAGLDLASRNDLF